MRRSDIIYYHYPVQLNTVQIKNLISLQRIFLFNVLYNACEFMYVINDPNIF